MSDDGKTKQDAFDAGVRSGHEVISTQQKVIERLEAEVARLRSLNESLAERVAAAENLLDELVSWAVANRGGPHAFVRCYTYEHGRKPHEIIAAEKYLAARELLTQRAEEGAGK